MVLNDIVERIRGVYDNSYSHNYRQAKRIYDEWDLNPCERIYLLTITARSGMFRGMKVDGSKEDVLEAAEEMLSHPEGVRSFLAIIALDHEIAKYHSEIAVDITDFILNDIPTLYQNIAHGCRFIERVPILIG